MTMLEKAAKAACEVDSRLHGWKPERAMADQGDRYRDLARAVLMAIREPPESVSDAGWQGMAGDASSWSWHHMERPQDEAFTAMIDAILTESDNPA